MDSTMKPEGRKNSKGEKHNNRFRFIFNQKKVPNQPTRIIGYMRIKERQAAWWGT